MKYIQYRELNRKKSPIKTNIIWQFIKSFFFKRFTNMLELLDALV